MVMGKLISNMQTSFIKGKHISEGILICNEVIHSLKLGQSSEIIIKIDFEKAFDSVDWVCILDAMIVLGFGGIWCGWVQAFLSSMKASVLINGSPTEEFYFNNGIRQGDPLSPFFIQHSGRSFPCSNGNGDKSKINIILISILYPFS